MTLEILNNSLVVLFGSILLSPFLVMLLYWFLNTGFEKLKDILR